MSARTLVSQALLPFEKKAFAQGSNIVVDAHHLALTPGIEAGGISMSCLSSMRGTAEVDPKRPQQIVGQPKPEPGAVKEWNLHLCASDKMRSAAGRSPGPELI